jgi:hypothetical protein
MLDERPHLSEVLDSDECGGLFWLARGGGCHGLGLVGWVSLAATKEINSMPVINSTEKCRITENNSRIRCNPLKT